MKYIILINDINCLLIAPTWSLTTSANTVAGTTANDTIDGSVTDTWSAFDTIDGGDGTDTMNVLVSTLVAPALVSVTNVENLNVNTTAAGLTLDTTGFTGLTKLQAADSIAGTLALTAATTTAVTATASVGAGAVTVIGSGGALSAVAGTGNVNVGQTAVANAITSATVSGGTLVNIQDRSGAAAATGSTLKTVSLTSNLGTATLTGDGITAVNLTTEAQQVDVVAAAGTRTLALGLNGVTGGTITDATATTLAVTNSTTATTGETIVAGAATSVTLAAGAALTVATLTAGVATAVGISGAARTTITADTLDAAAVVTSTSTGGVTLTQALTANQQFVGTSSTGADNISIATTSTKAHTTGAGSDTVIIGGAFGTGGSVDAGAGDTDVLSLTETLAANDSLGATSTFAGLVSNFEVLSLTTVTASKTVDLSKLDNLSYVTTTGATALVLDKLASGGTVEITAASTKVTAQITDANVGGHSTDVFNLKLNAATSGGNVAYGSVIVADVETVNIESTRSGTIVDADINTVNLTLANAVTVNVSGAVLADIDGAALASTALSTINASTNTGGARISVAGATQGIAILGSATKANLITGGNGADVITGGSGADTIVGGTGADVITAGAGADSITGGDGLDTITLTETTSAVDTIILGSLAADADSITGFTSAKDILNISAPLAAATLTIGTQIAAGASAAASIANITAAADTDAEVYYINNANGLTLTQIETAITAGALATGQATILVDNGTSTLVYFDLAAETDAGAGAGLILVATLVGVTGATALATGDLISA